MKKKTLKSKDAPKALESYKVIASVMGKKYEALGATVGEALVKLKVMNAKGKAILSVEKGGVRKEKILMPHLASRLFNSFGISREIAIKNTSIMFSGL